MLQSLSCFLALLIWALKRNTKQFRIGNKTLEDFDQSNPCAISISTAHLVRSVDKELLAHFHRIGGIPYMTESCNASLKTDIYSKM